MYLCKAPLQAFERQNGLGSVGQSARECYFCCLFLGDGYTVAEALNLKQKKHMANNYHYYVLISYDGTHTEGLIVKAYSMRQIMTRGYNVDNCVGYYEHYAEAKQYIRETCDYDRESGECMYNYVSLTGIDYAD